MEPAVDAEGDIGSVDRERGIRRSGRLPFTLTPGIRELCAAVDGHGDGGGGGGRDAPELDFRDAFSTPSPIPDPLDCGLPDSGDVVLTSRISTSSFSSGDDGRFNPSPLGRDDPVPFCL